MYYRDLENLMGVVVRIYPARCWINPLFLSLIDCDIISL